MTSDTTIRAAMPVPALSIRQQRALLALRISLGLLMLVWGADKLVNPEHGIKVAARFYFGVPSSRAMMPVLGALQCLLGVLVIAGVRRRITFGALTVITGITLFGVWRSVLDPWGWWMAGTNALFFPSLIVFAGALVLFTFSPAPRQR